VGLGFEFRRAHHIIFMISLARLPERWAGHQDSISPGEPR
jgi:hypothetical protein